MNETTINNASHKPRFHQCAFLCFLCFLVLQNNLLDKTLGVYTRICRNVLHCASPLKSVYRIVKLLPKMNICIELTNCVKTRYSVTRNINIKQKRQKSILFIRVDGGYRTLAYHPPFKLLRWATWPTEQWRLVCRSLVSDCKCNLCQHFYTIRHQISTW